MIYTYIHIYIYTNSLYKCTYIYVYIHTYIHVPARPDAGLKEKDGSVSVVSGARTPVLGAFCGFHGLSGCMGLEFRV